MSDDTKEIDNLHIISSEELPPPRELKQAMPVTGEALRSVRELLVQGDDAESVEKLGEGAGLVVHCAADDHECPQVGGHPEVLPITGHVRTA